MSCRSVNLRSAPPQDPGRPTSRRTSRAVAARSWPSAAPRTSCDAAPSCAEFVATAGGADARIVVVPTASSLGPEIVEVYDGGVPQARRRCGDRRPAGDPRGRARARRPGPARRRHGHLHDRRQPAQARRAICGTPFGDAIRAVWERGGGRRRHLGRGEHPVVPHGRLRPGRRHAQAADDPGRRRARAARRLRGGPALRAAQPLRPAADDRVPEPAAARPRRRRGHRCRRHPRGRARRPARPSGGEPSRCSTGHA